MTKTRTAILFIFTDISQIVGVLRSKAASGAGRRTFSSLPIFSFKKDRFQSVVNVPVNLKK